MPGKQDAEKPAKKGDSKEAGKGDKAGDKKEKPAPKPLTPWEELRGNTELLVKGVTTNDDRLVNKAIRSNIRVRRRLTSANLLKALAFVPNDAEAALSLRAFVEAFAGAEAAAQTAEDVDMSAGDETKADSEETPAGATPTGETGKKATPIRASPLPEVHAYLHLLALDQLFKLHLNTQALDAAQKLVAYVTRFNRRSLDFFGARAYAALSLAHEKQGTLDSIRADLMRAHRTSCLRHDEVGKATLLNLLLRNYLHYNLYEQANKLHLRAGFPGAVSNNQFVRYLYYTGRIHAVRLNYSDAHQCLLQATRKAPSHSALGFRCTVHRLMVVVQLLMGDLPDRAVFREKGLRVALRPHFLLAQAVRVGDLELFNRVLAEHADNFKADSTYTLILRLRNNVIKAGLRKIAVAYSTISFADIAEKLHLGSAEDAEFLAAKAIKDGVIEAKLDHGRSALVSNDTVDVYSTQQPQQALHTRIKFCLDVHNEAVKAMIYPPNAHRANKDIENVVDEEVDEEEIAAAVADEEGGDDGTV